MTGPHGSDKSYKKCQATVSPCLTDLVVDLLEEAVELEHLVQKAGLRHLQRGFHG